MSYLYTSTKQGAATHTGLSTQILIKVDGQSVGAIQTLSATQSRQIKPISEIGTDGNIELVPQGPVKTSLRVTRMVYDRKRLPEAFLRGFNNIHAQRIPFDIFVFDFSNVDPATVDSSYDVAINTNGADGVITTIYENCWFNNLQVTYQVTDYTIQEEAQLDCEFVHTFVNGDPSANATQIISGDGTFDGLESLADTSRRGSLDGRGLAQVGDLFTF